MYGRLFLQKKMLPPLLKSVLILHLTRLTDMGHLHDNICVVQSQPPGQERVFIFASSPGL